MQVALLCGGMGTRLREETEYRPKPLVPIGPMPILWHILKHYAHYGHQDFTLCLGYKGHLIKEFFMNLDWMANDFTLQFKSKKYQSVNHVYEPEDWRLTFADTGLDAPTGGRLYRIRKYVEGDDFCVTYGDGLSDVDLSELVAFHKKLGKIATLTAIHPMSPFGVIESKGGLAHSFKEKPRLEGLINGGFFVFKRAIFDYLDEKSVLEEEPLRRLATEGQLAVYEHTGFWMCMDTFKDVERLNAMWREGNTPWVIWK